jgi:hypothetical protein
MAGAFTDDGKERRRRLMALALPRPFFFPLPFRSRVAHVRSRAVAAYGGGGEMWSASRRRWRGRTRSTQDYRSLDADQVGKLCICVVKHGALDTNHEGEREKLLYGSRECHLVDVDGIRRRCAVATTR